LPKQPAGERIELRSLGYQAFVLGGSVREWVTHQ
jgi:hypothetical protein